MQVLSIHLYTYMLIKVHTDHSEQPNVHIITEHLVHHPQHNSIAMSLG